MLGAYPRDVELTVVSIGRGPSHVQRQRYRHLIRSRLHAPLAFATFALLLVFAAPAQGSSRSANPLRVRSATTSQELRALVFTGYSVINDRLAISGGPSGELIVYAEQGIRLGPGSPCVSNSKTQVTCPPGVADFVRFETYEGDDVVTADPLTTPLPLDFFAGPGNDFGSGTPSEQGDGFIGDQGDDIFSGAGGGDRLWGGIGKDRLFGEDSRDQLFGGPGDDTLFGGQGTDLLLGGAGVFDRCVGGMGRDFFSRNPLSEMGSCESVRK